MSQSLLTRGAFFYIAAAASILFGQGSTGNIAGTVFDPSGAVIGTSQISLLNLQTGFTRETVSGREGGYSFPLLEPGVYRVTAKHTGFRDSTKSRVVVNVGESTAVPFRLELAARNEEPVVIEEPTEPVLRTDAQLGHDFTHAEVTNLPLVTRNFTQFLSLEPGVVGDLPNAAAFGSGTQAVSVAGNRNYDTSVLINGINANGSITFSYSGNGPGPLGGISVPTPEAVEEFNAHTNSYSAELGRAGGASVDLATRAGTNNFHGSVYEFFRNEALNANEFFYKQAEALNALPNRQPLLRQNQFGAAIGGPLRRDRTFFFGSWQRTRQLNGAGPGLVQNLNRYPLLPAAREDETALRRALGAIYGGRTGLLGFGISAAGIPVSTVLPDGSNISPAAIRLLTAKTPQGGYLLPSFSPNAFSDKAGGRNGGEVYANGFYSLPGTFDEDQWDLSLTHLITRRQTVGVRLFEAGQYAERIAVNAPGFLRTSEPRNWNVSAAHTFVPGPSLVNELRAGFTRIDTPSGAQDAISTSAAGIKPAPGSAALPVIFVATANGLTLGNFQHDGRDVENMYTLADTASRYAGSHAMRFGGTFVRHQLNQSSDLLKNGQLLFYNFEDFLLGENAAGNNGIISNILSTAAQVGTFDRAYRFNDVSFFAQDDWRIRPNLTINLGLRYDYFAWPADRFGRMGNFDPALVAEGPFGTPPAAGSYTGYVISESFHEHYPNVAIPSGVAIGSKSTLRPDLNNFAPRLGFAWQPARHWAVRGGYGIFYPRVSAEIAVTLAVAPPFNFLSMASFTPQGRFADPFTFLNLPTESAFPQWTPRIYQPGVNASLFLSPVDRGIRNPYVQQWNLSVERELGHATLLRFSWIGSHGIRLINTRAANQPILASPLSPVRGVITNTAANITERSPIAGVLADRGLALTTSDAESKYEAAAVSVSRSFTSGFSLLSAFTWGKAIDNNSLTPSGSVGNAQAPNDNKDLQAYGLSAFDRKFRLSNSFIYDLPRPWNSAPGWYKAAASNWRVSGIGIFQSGTPLTFTVSTSGSALKLQGFSTPDLAPGATLDSLRGSGPVSSRLNNYFNTSWTGVQGSLFRTPSPLTYGSLGRGLEIRTPGQKTVDLAISRRFGLRERASLEFRGELYNAFNWTNFGAPATAVSASSFGSITSTTTAPRVVQLALRIEF